jgi:polar amino acid transport system substrate-binding protein
MIRAAALTLALTLGGIALSADANLAPTGTLRAAFLANNPVHARTDATTGAVTGPVVDLVERLARQLHVPFSMVPAPNAAGVIRAINTGAADVGFLAYDATRAQEVDFAGPFAVMFNSYVAPAASSLQTVDDVDRTGIRVGAIKGQTQEIFLNRTLKQARLRAFDAMPPRADIERLFSTRDLDAFAVNRQTAKELADASAGALRVLDGSYVSVDQSFVVRKGDAEAADLLNRFVTALKQTDFIQRSLARAGVVGAGVAP